MEDQQQEERMNVPLALLEITCHVLLKSVNDRKPRWPLTVVSLRATTLSTSVSFV